MMESKKYIYESPNGKDVYRREFGSDEPRELVEEFSWPLMKDCITQSDKRAMISFLENNSRLTNGPKVKQFEEEWSEWLGCKYSLFVSSGSTANFLLLAAIKEKYNLKDGDKVIVPAITWVTNVSPVFQLGLTPIFCDVDKTTFSFDTDYLKKIKKEHDDIKVVFVTHLFGISAEIEEYKKILPNAVFIEDVCESHGATLNGKKCGTLSEGSTFSSYFGHHMTTVEGGFVSTDDKELYNLMKVKRSHGMAREALPKKFEEYKEIYSDIHPMFMFVTDGYNFRSQEINAVLGSSQLVNLDKNNDIRRKNFGRFIKMVSKYSDYFISNYKVEGNSSFCLPFICKSAEFKSGLEKWLSEHKVETRPLCSGNLLRQPFLRQLKMGVIPTPVAPSPKEFDNAEFLHEHGFFIGNNHMISDKDFTELERLVKEYVTQS